MTEEKLKDILTRIILIIMFVGFTLMCCLIASSNKYEEDINILRNQNKKLQYEIKDKNHIIKTILEKCGEKCYE